MGITGAARVLLKLSQGKVWFAEPTTDERTGKCVSLVGQFVAVDLGSFAYLASTFKEEALQGALGNHVPMTKAADYIQKNIVDPLFALGVAGVYLVCDGGPYNPKAATQESRRVLRKEAKAKIPAATTAAIDERWRLCPDGKPQDDDDAAATPMLDALVELKRDAAGPDERLLSTFLSCLSSKTVIVVSAPYEADAQVVAMLLMCLVHFIVSVDSDLTMIGAPAVFTTVPRRGKLALEVTHSVLFASDSMSEYTIPVPKTKKTIEKKNTKKNSKITSSKSKSVEAKNVESKSGKAKSVKAKSVKAKSVKAKSVKAKSVKAKSVKAKTIKTIKTKTANVKLPVIGPYNGWSLFRFIVFAIMCGVDYLPGIQLRGPANAYKAFVKDKKYNVSAPENSKFKGTRDKESVDADGTSYAQKVETCAVQLCMQPFFRFVFSDIDLTMHDTFVTLAHAARSGDYSAVTVSLEPLAMLYTDADVADAPQDVQEYVIGRKEDGSVRRSRVEDMWFKRVGLDRVHVGQLSEFGAGVALMHRRATDPMQLRRRYDAEELRTAGAYLDISPTNVFKHRPVEIRYWLLMHGVEVCTTAPRSVIYAIFMKVYNNSHLDLFAVVSRAQLPKPSEASAVRWFNFGALVEIPWQGPQAVFEFACSQKMPTLDARFFEMLMPQYHAILLRGYRHVTGGSVPFDKWEITTEAREVVDGGAEGPQVTVLRVPVLASQSAKYYVVTLAFKVGDDGKLRYWSQASGGQCVASSVDCSHKLAALLALRVMQKAPAGTDPHKLFPPARNQVSSPIVLDLLFKRKTQHDARKLVRDAGDVNAGGTCDSDDGDVEDDGVEEEEDAEEGDDDDDDASMCDAGIHGLDLLVLGEEGDDELSSDDDNISNASGAGMQDIVSVINPIDAEGREELSDLLTRQVAVVADQQVDKAETTWNPVKQEENLTKWMATRATGETPGEVCQTEAAAALAKVNEKRDEDDDMQSGAILDQYVRAMQAGFYSEAVATPLYERLASEATSQRLASEATKPRFETLHEVGNFTRVPVEDNILVRELMARKQEREQGKQQQQQAAKENRNNSNNSNK